MQDRFEKEVQQKMEELKMTPSAPVWEKIEMKITPEKKRRRVIFWFVFAGLLLAGTAWWLAASFTNDDKQMSSENSVSNTSINDPYNNKSSVTKPNESTTNSKTNEQSPAQITTAKRDDNKQGSDIIRDDERTSANTTLNKPVNNSEPFQPIKKPRVNTTESTVIDKKNREENTVSITPAIDKKEPTPANNILDKPKPFSDMSTTIIDSANNILTPPSPSSITDSTTTPVMKKETPPEILAVDSSAKKKIATNKNWTKQINLMLGNSSYASGLSLLKSGSAQDAFSIIGSGGTSSAANNFQSSAPSGGLGFSLGYSMSKKLSEHWQLSFGLQYTHLSTKTKVGDERQANAVVRYSADSVNVEKFYTNTGTNNYTNRFHVLEVPVTISYRPAVKLPLYISAGISYGRLISSNALTFSSTSNIYYRNKDNYVRNLLPAQASVQYRFADKKKRSLQTGPFIQYNLLEFEKESTGTKSHLLFAGLKTIINF